MNTKRFLGFVIVLVGMLISLSRATMTGSSVGIEKSSIAGILGGLLVFLGMLFILTSRKQN